MDFITVRAGKVPGSINSFTLGTGARKVSDLLALAELDVGDHEIRVNSQPRTADFELNENDTVLLLKKIKGN